MGKSKFSKDHIEILNNCYAENGAEFCSKLMPFSVAQIRNKAKNLGIKLHKKTLSLILSKRKTARKTNIYLDQFIEITDKFSAYIFGFLWADGHLDKNNYTIRLEIMKKDFEDIMYIFDETKSWRYAERTRINHQPVISATISSKVFCEYLQQLDLCEKSKISANKILSKIPDNLKCFWWQGFFDGDGCFYHNTKNKVYHATLAGSYEQDWSFVENLYKNLKIKYSINRNKTNLGNYSHIRIANVLDIIKLGNFLYESGCIGLQRKFEKFNIIKNSKCNVYIITDPIGKSFEVCGLKSWCRDNEFNYDDFRNSHRFNKKTKDGWFVEKIK